jgi:UDP-glucose 4-epimerase
VYGVSKLAGEGLLREASERHGFDHVCLRLFFAYGPRQFSGSEYRSMIERNFSRILDGAAPEISGDGTQSLDYVHVNDVAEAFIAASETPISNEIFNVGTGRAVSINELTEMMMEISGTRRQPIHTLPDWTAGTYRVSDPSKMSRVLGWTAKIPIERGLQEVWDSMKRTCQ